MRRSSKRLIITLSLFTSLFVLFFTPGVFTRDVKAYDASTHSISAYYYNQLSQNEKLLYDGLYNLCYNTMYDGSDLPYRYT